MADFSKPSQLAADNPSSVIALDVHFDVELAANEPGEQLRQRQAVHAQYEGVIL